MLRFIAEEGSDGVATLLHTFVSWCETMDEELTVRQVKHDVIDTTVSNQVQCRPSGLTAPSETTPAELALAFAAEYTFVNLTWSCFRELAPTRLASVLHFSFCCFCVCWHTWWKQKGCNKKIKSHVYHWYTPHETERCKIDTHYQNKYNFASVKKSKKKKRRTIHKRK